MAFILVSCLAFSLAFRLVGFGAAVGLKSTDFQDGVGLQAVLHVGVQADLRDRFGPLFCTAFRIFSEWMCGLLPEHLSSLCS